MRKQIRLGLDLDGVVTDFNAHFIKLARERYPHINCPDASAEYPRAWDYMDEHLTDKEIRDLWNHVCTESEDFWETSPAYQHSQDLLRVACAKADYLYFITSRAGRTVQQQTYRRLESMYDLTQRGAVICTPSAEAKIPIIKALQLTHYVDDKKETIMTAAQNCDRTKVACWVQPWNRNVQYPVNVKELTGVKEFESWLM